MVVDAGQIKAETGQGRGEEKREEIHESITIAVEMVKLCFLTLKPDESAKISQISVTSERLQ